MAALIDRGNRGLKTDAYYLGYNSFWYSIGPKSNPYRRDSTDYDDWLMGWQAAARVDGRVPGQAADDI